MRTGRYLRAVGVRPSHPSNVRLTSSSSIRPAMGAAVSMRVEDYFVQGRRGWVRLHEKGGKEHEMPTHHNLDHYLEEYIAAAGISKERKEPLFRTTRGHRDSFAPYDLSGDIAPPPVPALRPPAPSAVRPMQSASECSPVLHPEPSAPQSRGPLAGQVRKDSINSHDCHHQPHQREESQQRRLESRPVRQPVHCLRQRLYLHRNPSDRDYTHPSRYRRLRQRRSNHQQRMPARPIVSHSPLQEVNLRLLIARQPAVLCVIRHARHRDSAVRHARRTAESVSQSDPHPRTASPLPAGSGTTSGASPVLSSSVKPRPRITGISSARKYSGLTRRAALLGKLSDLFD
jgi:hypothetical protein